MKNPVRFRWGIPECGYAWVEARPTPKVGSDESQLGPSGRYLVESAPTGTLIRERLYEPLEVRTGLFHEFAATEPTEEGILAFANRHGSLGTPVARLVCREDETTEDPQTPCVMGEPLEVWQDEIVSMRQVVDVWGAVQRDDTKYLRRHIKWGESGLVSFDSHPSLPRLGGPLDLAAPDPGDRRDSTWIASPHYKADLWEHFSQGEVVKPALGLVQREVNTHLSNRISARLLWNRDFSGLDMYVVPRGLLDALWLQFALAVEGGKRYRQCDACRLWFEVSPARARTNRKYCSDACKSRYWRTHRPEAELANRAGEAQSP